MNTDHVVFLVEEPSMEEFLRQVAPRLLGSVTFEIHQHGDKASLFARLPGRLRGLSKSMSQTWRIVILVDRDRSDCLEVKRKLEAIASEARLKTRSTSSSSYSVVNRVVIEELEAWYFGDWEAVRQAYPRLPNVAGRSGFRNPDDIKGGTWEALERILQRAGYFLGGLNKIEAARAIGSRVNADRNKSRSFQVFRDAIREFCVDDR